MTSKGKRKFNPTIFLATVGKGRTITEYPKNEIVFSQGDPADAIFYIQKGKVKLTVKSKNGKEAVIAIFGVGDFSGEGCLAAQRRRMATATTMSDCSLVRLEKSAITRVLHEKRPFNDMFRTYLLSRIM